MSCAAASPSQSLASRSIATLLTEPSACKLPSRRALPAVSRRFCRVFWSTAPLWRQLRIAIDHTVAGLTDAELACWFEGRQRLLQRVAGMAQRVEIAGEPEPDVHRSGDGLPGEGQWARVGWRAAALLAGLDRPGAAVESVTVRVWGLRLSWAEAAALCRLPRLQRLWLGPSDEFDEELFEGRCQLPATAASALGQLSAMLQVLCLIVDCLPSTAVPAICRLAGLTQLTLDSSAPLPSLQRLEDLRQLQMLRLQELYSNPEGLRPPDPGLMPALVTLQMVARRIQVGG